MKKILALVLALVMVMTAAFALAEGSKTQGDISNGTVTGGGGGQAATEEETTETELPLEKVEDEKLQAIIDAVTAAAKDGDALKGLPEAVAGQIPEGFKTINEMSCWKISGDIESLAGDDLVMK